MSTPWYETPLSKAIMEKKYFHDGEDFKGFIDRVVGIFSKELQPKIREALMNGEFFPAGRSLYGAGSKDSFKATMQNCFCLPSPEDSLESTYDVNKIMARIFSYGVHEGLRKKDRNIHEFQFMIRLFNL